MSSLETFRLLCRDLEDIPDYDVVSVLSLAARQLNADTLDNLYEMACCYLAGHLLISGTRGGATGQVLHQKVGGVEVRYASTNTHQQWETTSYGQLLAGLVRSATGSQAFISTEGVS